MANEEHLKILQDGADVWNSWREANDDLTPDLRGAKLEGIDLGRAKLYRTDLRGANLENANLEETNFGEADLQRANLRGTKFTRTILYGANLGGCDLFEADLTGAYVDDLTRLDRANVRSCEISRYILECLSDYGGLTKGARTKMIIHDDLSDLRAAFSGMRLWLHLLALGAFLFPYLSFTTFRYFEAHFFDDGGAHSIALWKAIARYVWNGGQNWQSHWDFHWSFVAFVALSIYNICRWLLLSKTILLEHLQEISGLPSSFQLQQEPFWNALVKSMSFLFWIGLAILMLNTGHFLTQQVPI